MSSRATLTLAGLLLALGVVMGALGVHVFHGRFSADEYLIYQVAQQFHFYQALGLLGAVPPVAGPLMIAGWLTFAWGAWRSRPLAP